MIHPQGKVCPGCWCVFLNPQWQTIGDGRRQIRGTCARCGRFRLWVPMTEDAKAEADSSTPIQIQGPNDELNTPANSD